MSRARVQYFIIVETITQVAQQLIIFMGIDTRMYYMY